MVAVQLSNVTTFGSLCDCIMGIITSYGKQSNALHIVMENYKHMSIKSSERRRRADKPPGRLCEVVSAKQPLPDMDDFFTNLDNKISFQNFFVKYHVATYKSSKPLFIAGGLIDDPERCKRIKNGYVKEKPSFRASHFPTKKQTIVLCIRSSNCIRRILMAA